MILDLDIGKAKGAISHVIDEQNNEVLQNMYSYFESNKLISQIQLLKIWTKIIPVEQLDDDTVEALAEFLVSEQKDKKKSGIFVDLDTRPIKKGYLSSIKNEDRRKEAHKFLEIFTEKIESVYEKDLCQLSHDEAMRGLESLPNLSPPTLRAALVTARGYCQWCIENNAFDGREKNAFKHIAWREIKLDTWVRKNVVRDEIDLAERLRSIPRNGEDDLKSVVVALSWMGFSIDEMLALEDRVYSAINEEISGRKIPDALQSIFISYSNLVSNEADKFVVKTPKYLKNIFGRNPGVPRKKSEIYNTLREMNGMTYKDIRTSAILLELYRKEISGANITDDDFADAFQISRDNTSFYTYVLDKRNIYEAYKRVYWNA